MTAFFLLVAYLLVGLLVSAFMLVSDTFGNFVAGARGFLLRIIVLVILPWIILMGLFEASLKQDLKFVKHVMLTGNPDD